MKTAPLTLEFCNGYEKKGDKLCVQQLSCKFIFWQENCSHPISSEVEAHILKSLIGPDQFAYKENSNTTMALVKSQHYWLKWLDGNANFVRVLSFDFSKAFDTVSHYILSDKFKATDINPYVIN